MFPSVPVSRPDDPLMAEPIKGTKKQAEYAAAAAAAAAAPVATPKVVNKKKKR